MHLSINTRSTKNHRKARPLRFEVFYTPAKNLFTYHFTIEWNHFAPMFFSRDFLKHSKLVVTELSVFKSIRYFRRILGVYTWFCCCIFFLQKIQKKNSKWHLDFSKNMLCSEKHIRINYFWTCVFQNGTCIFIFICISFVLWPPIWHWMLFYILGVLLKFSFSEKATKNCAILLMVLPFTY